VTISLEFLARGGVRIFRAGRRLPAGDLESEPRWRWSTATERSALEWLVCRPTEACRDSGCRAATTAWTGGEGRDGRDGRAVDECVQVPTSGAARGRRR